MIVGCIGENYELEKKGGVDVNVVNPMGRSSDGIMSNCRCICDTGSAYWNTYGASYSTRCGCQCQEGNTANASANYTYATANAPTV